MKSIFEKKSYTLCEKLLPTDNLIRTDGENSFAFAAALQPGDTIYLSAGEIVPADCVLLDALCRFEGIKSLGISECERYRGDFITSGMCLSEGENIAFKVTDSFEASTAQIYMHTHLKGFRTCSRSKRIISLLRAILFIDGMAGALITALLPLFVSGITTAFSLPHCLFIILICGNTIAFGSVINILYKAVRSCFLKGTVLENPDILLKLSKAKGIAFSFSDSDAINIPAFNKMLSFLKKKRIHTSLLSSSDLQTDCKFSEVFICESADEMTDKFLSLKDSIHSRKKKAYLIYTDDIPANSSIRNAADINISVAFPRQLKYKASSDIFILSANFPLEISRLISLARKATFKFRLTLVLLMLIKIAVLTAGFLIPGINIFWFVLTDCLAECAVYLLNCR